MQRKYLEDRNYRMRGFVAGFIIVGGPKAIWQSQRRIRKSLYESKGKIPVAWKKTQGIQRKQVLESKVSSNHS